MSPFTIIVPNLNWRYSGVTSANRMMAPRLARRFALVWVGPFAPADVPRLGLGVLLALRFRRKERVIWHARRNIEMALGLLLRGLGWPLRLVFTSAAQRRHRAFTRWMIGRMDHVIAASAAAASYLDRPSTVVLHGIDTERFRPPADRAAAFAAAKLPGRYAVGCFGRVREQKGTDLFVAAMCRLLPRYPDFCAVVLGPVTLEEQRFNASLKEQVRQAGLAGRVLFLGERPLEELPTWYRRLTIYAFTSRNEGFGLTLLEAMASGNAVVAARAGAAEIVIENGETGLLVEAGDADALATGLETLMRDPSKAAAMGEKALAHVVAAFSADAEAERIAAVYDALLREPEA